MMAAPDSTHIHEIENVTKMGDLSVDLVMDDEPVFEEPYGSVELLESTQAEAAAIEFSMMSFEADACTVKKPKTKINNSNQKKKPKCQSSERFDRDDHIFVETYKCSRPHWLF